MRASEIFISFAFLLIFCTMQHPSEKLLNEQYISGLRTADREVLIAVYEEFRTPTVRAVASLGGSDADGGIFFRAAVVECARQARAGELPEEEPFFLHLQALAIAHFRDWQAERREKAGIVASEADDSAATDSLSSTIPTSAMLRQTRRSIYSWRHFEQLTPHCQHEVLDSLDDQATEDAPLSASPCRDQYIAQLQLTSPDGPGLPDWAIHALRDSEGYHFWQETQSLERKIANREPFVTKPLPAYNHWFPRLLIGLGISLLLYSGYNYFFGAAASRAAYKDNFQPPASILADLKTRQATDTMSIEGLPARPIACEEMLRQADASYLEKDYTSAAQVLYRITEDESLAPCHSDALFYLGIVGLQLGDPSTTLQCFAKIDNLDRFGEDIYWYQALAFVKLSEKQPELRDRAARAVERAIAATQNPERRAQAEEMLKRIEN